VKNHIGVKRWITEPFQHRTLFWGFVNQDIKGRYAGSVFGMIWSLVLPLANLLIYIFVFTVIFKIRLKPENGTEDFVLYLLSGLLPWMAFSEALGSSPGIFVGKANLITKVAFPIELLPISGVAVVFFMNSIGLLFFIVFLAIQGYCNFSWLVLPVVMGVHMLFTLGLVVLIASLSVFIRDIQQVIGVVLSLWMYLTPILYPITMVPEQIQWILYLNPMCMYIELYHQVLLCKTIPWGMLLNCFVLALAMFIAGTGFFGKSRNAFADVL
jgi:lipopolysaccharide transport system permease protein